MVKSKHPLYAAWHEIHRYKGKYNVCPRWDDFWLFAEDVGERPPQRSALRRVDRKQGFFPSNVEWRIYQQSGAHKDKAAYGRQWRKDHHRQCRSREVERRYGITLDEFDAMLERQGHKCAICEQPESVQTTKSGVRRSLSIDHCHETGKVRGLLCMKCNSLIGHGDDNVETLRRAIEYLDNS